MYKFVIFLMLIASSALSNDDVDTFEKLKKYLFFNFSHVPLNERVEEVNKLEVVIDDRLKENPDDVKNNMLKGLQLYANIYAYSDLPKSKVRELKLESQEFLKVALERNKFEKSLSIAELEVIRAYSGPTLIPVVVDEIVNSNNSYDEKVVVELKRSKIDHLIRLGRFDEARKEMEETNQEHPTFKSAEWDEAFEGQIVEVKEKMTEQEEEPPVEAEIKDTSIENDEVESVVDEAPKKEVGLNPKPEEMKIILIDNRYWPFLLAILAVIGLYLYSRKKQKKK